MRTAMLGVMCLTAGIANAQLIPFSASYTGSVNGGALSASGGGFLDIGQQGQSEASIGFDALPMGFDPLSVSLISNLCSNAFRADGDSRNLWDLGAGSYSVFRTFQWIGLSGSLVTIDSQVVNDDGFVSTTNTVSGSYSGPTDIVGISNYSVTWLPSTSPGEFFEAGTVVLERATGGQLIMQFASVFSGLGSGLNAPQTGSGLFDTSFDGRTLVLEWDGEFEVVPTPSAAAMLVVAGLATSRRRR
jgi:hypothetical protein